MTSSGSGKRAKSSESSASGSSAVHRFVYVYRVPIKLSVPKVHDEGEPVWKELKAAAVIKVGIAADPCHRFTKGLPPNKEFDPKYHPHLPRTGPTGATELVSAESARWQRVVVTLRNSGVAYPDTHFDDLVAIFPICGKKKTAHQYEVGHW